MAVEEDVRLQYWKYLCTSLFFYLLIYSKSKRFSFNAIVYSSQLIVAQSIVVRDFKKSQFILGPLRPIHAKRLISLQEYSTGV